MRGRLGLLRDRAFGGVTVAQILSALGAWSYSFTAVAMVAGATGSAAAAAAVTAAQFASQLLVLLSTAAGVDRGLRSSRMIAGFALAAAAPAVLVVSGLLGSSVLPAALVGAVMLGAGSAVSGPAGRAIVSDLVSTSELPAAVSLGALPLVVARISGPVLAAVLLVYAGGAAPLLLALALKCSSALIILLVRPAMSEAPAPGGAAALGGLLAAYRAAAASAPLRSSLLAVMALASASGAVLPLAPVVSSHLGGGDLLAGTLASGFGVGAALGLLLLPRLRRRFGTDTGWCGLGALSGCFALAAASSAASGPWVTSAVAAAVVVAGAGMSVALSEFTTRVHRASDPRMLGRMMVLWTVALVGVRPPSALLFGAVADALSAPAALAAVAACSSAMAIAARLASFRTRVGGWVPQPRSGPGSADPDVRWPQRRSPPHG